LAYVTGFSDSVQDGLGVTILRYYTGFSLRWQIPLLFFIAGASACLSLSHRSPGAFVRERARRLFVPLMFFMLVCYPALLYFWPDVCENKSLSGNNSSQPDAGKSPNARMGTSVVRGIPVDFLAD